MSKQTKKWAIAAIAGAAKLAIAIGIFITIMLHFDSWIVGFLIAITVIGYIRTKWIAAIDKIAKALIERIETGKEITIGWENDQKNGT